MQRGYRTRLWGAVVLLTGLAAAGAAHSDAVSAVNVLRVGGCGGLWPMAAPLRHSALLDRVAAEWAGGHSLAAAAEGGGYNAADARGMHLRAEESSLLEHLRRSSCPKVMGRDLREIGLYRAGLDSWLVVSPGNSPRQGPGTPHAQPQPPQRAAVSPPAAASPAQSAASGALTAEPSAQSGGLASRALRLVNDARARGTRCGGHSFGPAPPLALSWTLAGVAFGHATDMADHGYFEHEDLSGNSPADRVRAVGYREKLVGENIAYGPITVEEVVQAWLDSPDHCENIMDPRFAEMGIAFATGRTARRGLYWVQVFAEPRA